MFGDRYAKTDAASLAHLRRELLPPRYSKTELGIGVAVTGTVAAGEYSPLHAMLMARIWLHLWGRVTQLIMSRWQDNV